MASSQIQILIKQAKGTAAEVIDIPNSVAGRSEPLRIKAQPGLRYQLKDLAREGQTAPEMVKVKRVGKDLHIMLEAGGEAPQLVLEAYYEVVPDGFAGLTGEAETGRLHEYIVEGADAGRAITSLADVQGTSYAFLGEAVSNNSAASLGLLALNPLVAGASFLGAAAGSAGGDGGTTTAPVGTTTGPAASNNTPLEASFNANTGVISGTGATPGQTVTATLPNGSSVSAVAGSG